MKPVEMHNPAPADDAPTFIDLFCGCGGASLGFIQAGYRHLCGIDMAKDALKTYQYNLGNAIKADVRFLPLREGIQPTLVHYSPPCQGFSISNTNKKTKDGKLKPKYRFMNRLMLYAALAVEYLQPEFISMENVPPKCLKPVAHRNRFESEGFAGFLERLGQEWAEQEKKRLYYDSDSCPDMDEQGCTYPDCDNCEVVDDCLEDEDW